MGIALSCFAPSTPPEALGARVLARALNAYTRETAQRDLRDAFDALGLGGGSVGLGEAQLKGIIVTGAPAAAMRSLGVLIRYHLLALDKKLSGKEKFTLLQHLAAHGCEAVPNTDAMPLAQRLATMQDAGANLDLRDKAGRGLLHIAAEANNADTIRALAHCGVPSFVTDKKRATPLMRAATLGHERAIEALIEIGADPNFADPENRATALHLAALSDQRGPIRALLAGGANLDALMWANPRDDGYTPLNVAAAGCKTEALRALVEARQAQVASRQKIQSEIDHDFGRALHLAALNKKYASVETLSELGCNLDTPNAEGNSALHLAAYKGDARMVDCLIKAGANINLPNNNGDRPVDVAGSNSNCFAFQALVDAGAEGPHVYRDPPPMG